MCNTQMPLFKIKGSRLDLLHPLHEVDLFEAFTVKDPKEKFTSE